MHLRVANTLLRAHAFARPSSRQHLLLIKPRNRPQLLCRSNQPSLDDVQLRQAVDASAQLVDDLIRAITKESLLEAAANYVANDEAKAGTVRQIVRTAVKSRLDDMNETFLGTIDGYMMAAMEKGGDNVQAQEIVALLAEIRDAVLMELTALLPGEMQVTQMLVTAESSAARKEVIDKCTSDDPESPLKCSVQQLLDISSSMIMDLERMPQIPDPKLLAKLCLVKSELAERILVEKAGFNAIKGSPGSVGDSGDKLTDILGKLGKTSSTAAFPAYIFAFIKNLMQVADSDMRKALLSDSFKESLAFKNSGAQPPLEEGQVNEVMLPGSFMDALGQLQQEMLQSVEVGKLAVDENVLVRLEDLRRDTVFVLTDMAGETEGYTP